MLEPLDNRFTGLFTLFVRVENRPHDPAVPMTAGEMPAWRRGDPELGCGGAGWTGDEADRACLGEGVERVLARALPCDQSLDAAWSSWPHREPAVNPAGWVLFHPDQYASKGFPFTPLTPETATRWVCCRRAVDGGPVWVPEELVFLTPRPGELQRHAPGYSTGLSCGARAHPVLLRGAQEVIERDALVGGWWGRYPVEEWPREIVRQTLGMEICHRVERPNLHYRFYRIDSPFSRHVTLVSLSGEDEEGWVFSVGSACRETRETSWRKSLLEAIQGRHCVRRLLGRWSDDGRPDLQVPTTFFEHALWTALHRSRLSETMLEQAGAPIKFDDDPRETVADLQTALGPDRPILFRDLTPPGLGEHESGWLVLRVLIPGLQPLHGDHRLPFLGGPLWAGRPLTDWDRVTPHPFA